MNILLVEDEPGIREGLAAFLRLKGHVVHAAATRAEGEHAAAAGSFEMVVTDWRLGDGLGADILARCCCPAIVMTGHPEDVATQRSDVTVLCKPVSPTRLLAEIERQDAPAELPPAAQSRLAGLGELPRDTRDRIRLADSLTGEHPAAELESDSDVVVFRTPADDGGARDRLSPLGGDLRVVAENGQPWVELRLHRDGRPQGARVVAADAPLPPGREPCAIDLDGAPCTPDEFVALLRSIRAAVAGGRTVHLLNIPPHLRLHVEGLGLTHLLPMRPKSGPRLPDVLIELWRHG